MANHSASSSSSVSHLVPDSAEVFRHWKRRSDAENFQRNLDFLRQHVVTETGHQAPLSGSSRWLFSHVPKTAGTTLESILAKNVPLKDILRTNAPVLNGCPCSYGANGRHPLLCLGHHPMHGLIYQLLPAAPLFHFTLVRHPLSRVISWFNYLKNTPWHALNAKVRQMNLDEFLDQPELVETRNGQCRRFSGYLHRADMPEDNALFTQAREVLEQAFSFVGTTEHFDESLLILQRLLGLTDIYYRRLNQSQKTLSAEDISPAQRERILTMNRADVALHDWVNHRLDEQIGQFLAGDALKRFQHNNRRWQELLDAST